MTTADLLLALCMFLGAVLYTSVGHAGASAYLALMALFGVPAAVMRPTALVLNILVSSLTSFRYSRARLFRWRTLWPFLIGALPLPLLGWSSPKTASGIVAVFILCNSIAGLGGNIASVQALPANLPLFAGSVI